MAPSYIAGLSTLHFFCDSQVGEGFMFLCVLASLDVHLAVAASSSFSSATQVLKLPACVITPNFNITSFFYDLIGVCVFALLRLEPRTSHMQNKCPNTELWPCPAVPPILPHIPECWDHRSVPPPHLKQSSLIVVLLILGARLLWDDSTLQCLWPLFTRDQLISAVKNLSRYCHMSPGGKAANLTNKNRGCLIKFESQGSNKISISINWSECTL